MTFAGNSGRAKGEEVSEAVRSVVDRLRTSKNKDCFDVIMWGYGNSSDQILPQTPVGKINQDSSFNPCKYISDYTNTKLHPALKDVQGSIQNYLRKHDRPGVPAKAMVLILSDGALSDQEICLKTTNEFKLDARVHISSMFFESAGVQKSVDVELQKNLRELASGDELFRSSSNIDEIRDHMIHSISSISEL